MSIHQTFNPGRGVGGWGGEGEKAGDPGIMVVKVQDDGCC